MTELLGIRGVQDRDKTKTLPEMVRQGCHFVVQGEAFEALMAVLDKAIDGANDAPTKSWLVSLRAAIETTTVPVKPKPNQVVAT